MWVHVALLSTAASKSVSSICRRAITSIFRIMPLGKVWHILLAMWKIVSLPFFNKDDFDMKYLWNWMSLNKEKKPNLRKITE